MKIRTLLFDFKRLSINVNSARLGEKSTKSKQADLRDLRGEFYPISWTVTRFSHYCVA